ncbi:MAG: leucine-rich repeat domain-containing protein, partial [Acholeplasmataceae bacterium]|nr:leucine-rich repeat domain-containing protein [Acholeplasmataceae bacterium]
RLCYSLESIEIDENNANFQVINNVLYNKDATKLIRYPAGRSDTSYVVPNTVTVIGEDAFSSSFQLISITLGNSVTSIESHAFFYCANLTFMDIPNHVTSVALYAFRDCIGLESVSIGSGLNTISSYLFNRCTSLSTITLPYNILSIGYGAFYDCLDLQTVYMTRSSMDGITTGALFMFTNTSSQLKIYVPDAPSVTVYKESSFWMSYASKIEINPS